ncbi:hypothetical protein pb186bvf_011698 [Paramecium bursaria]
MHNNSVFSKIQLFHLQKIFKSDIFKIKLTYHNYGFIHLVIMQIQHFIQLWVIYMYL